MMLRLIVLMIGAALAALAVGLASDSAVGHRDGCHRAHTCPSDHATYSWRGWLCAAADSARRNSTFRKRIRHGGRTYYCKRKSTPLTATCVNHSTPTGCAEEDNVNIPLRSRSVRSFVIEATHPRYAVATDNCEADFTNCPASGGPNYPFTPGVFKVFDDGKTVVEAVREPSWWRPSGMTASADARPRIDEIHYVRIYRKIPGVAEWPQFFVLYADGNLRLVPHPPVGARSVCFGSSVIVGRAPIRSRPIAEVASVNYVSVSKTLQVTYKAGGSATLSLGQVSRKRARVVVTVRYPTRTDPFATLRSMFVSNRNADVDHVRWTDASGVLRTKPVARFRRGEGREWFFFRRTPSRHNTSAPDMRITLRR
jgi:hypothetical protein